MEFEGETDWREEEVQGKGGLLGVFEREVLGRVEKSGEVACVFSASVDVPGHGVFMLAACGTPEECFVMALKAMTQTAQELAKRNQRAEKGGVN